MEEHIEKNNLNREDFPVLFNIPEILPHLRWIWEGFHALSGSRQRGFSGLQPLTMVDTLAYMNGYLRLTDQEEREDFLHYVQFLDRIFVQKIDERAAANSKSRGKK